MTKTVHTIYVALLAVVGVGTAVFVGVSGFDYYATAQDVRSEKLADLDAKKSDIDVELELLTAGLATMGKSKEELLAEKARLDGEAKRWNDWKPSGLYGHGLGIIGSAMMLIGVTLYSSRKRWKRLRFTGKIKHWLEFHIFLCLLGPTLVIFHTTFKFGGIVSVSLWSMVFVVLSGIAGRYIYTQIPKSADGSEVSQEELDAENERMKRTLAAKHGVPPEVIALIDAASASLSTQQSTLRKLLALIKDDLLRPSRMGAIRRALVSSNVPRDHIHDILTIAKKKATLARRIAFLNTARSLFHYWHVVHQPFSIIMFIILIIHVILTVSLGYTWIF